MDHTIISARPEQLAPLAKLSPDELTTAEVIESQRDFRKLARHEVSGWT